jgi:hypothetical protein
VSVQVAAVLDVTKRDWQQGAEVWGDLMPRSVIGQEDEQRAASVARTLVSVY